MSTDLVQTGITELQRRKLEHRFALVDINGDGAIQQDDYEQIASRVAEALGQDPDGPRATALREGYLTLWKGLLRKMDADGDGRIIRDEFVASVAGSVIARDGFTRHIEPVAQALLALADTNNNGTLGADEFTRILGALAVPDGDAAQAFALLDRDRSGRLTLDELMAAIRDFYTSPDPEAPGNALFGVF